VSRPFEGRDFVVGLAPRGPLPLMPGEVETDLKDEEPLDPAIYFAPA
jgi:hypothetical protein